MTSSSRRSCKVGTHGGWRAAVADVEYALGEKEFIYSLNRMNVSITRARMKTILFISRALLEPPIQALDNDDVADGIAFIQGVARFFETGAERMRLDLGAGTTATVLRARPAPR